MSWMSSKKPAKVTGVFEPKYYYFFNAVMSKKATIANKSKTADGTFPSCPVYHRHGGVRAWKLLISGATHKKITLSGTQTVNWVVWSPFCFALRSTLFCLSIFSLYRNGKLCCIYSSSFPSKIKASTTSHSTCSEIALEHTQWKSRTEI